VEKKGFFLQYHSRDEGRRARGGKRAKRFVTGTVCVWFLPGPLRKGGEGKDGKKMPSRGDCQKKSARLETDRKAKQKGKAPPKENSKGDRGGTSQKKQKNILKKRGALERKNTTSKGPARAKEASRGKIQLNKKTLARRPRQGGEGNEKTCGSLELSVGNLAR